MAEPWLELDVVVRGSGPRRMLTAEARCVGVSGPSGAGKSTLLHVLAGVEPRVEGTVRVFGEDWGHRPAWSRGVGWVPQDALLFPHLSVEENLGYAGRGVDREVVDALGLARLLGRAPRYLSGGERQRVALGRALCARPRLLLLDEPFTSLDPSLRAEVAAYTHAWCARHEAHVVLVSHEPRELDALAGQQWSCQDGYLSPI